MRKERSVWNQALMDEMRVGGWNPGFLEYNRFESSEAMREIWIRPSSAGRWAGPDGCPASATYAPPPHGSSETIYTMRGTRIHSALAHMMDPSQPKPHKLNDEERETANHMRQLINDTIDVEAYEWIVERKIGMKLSGVYIDGSPDLVGFSKTDSQVPIEIIDAKAGLGVIVEAEGNYQLLTYAVLVLEQNDRLYALRGKIADDHPGFNVRIVQPGNVMHHQPPVKTAHVRYAEACDYRNHLKALLADLSDEGKVVPHNPTPENCRWCSAKDRCKAFQDTAMSVVDDADGRVSADGDSFKLPVGDWAEFLNRAKIVEQMKDAVEREAERRLRDGKVVPGLKLVQTRMGQRKWGDQAAYASDMVRAMGSDGSPIFIHEPRLKSPRQMEQEIGKLTANDVQVELRERMDEVIRTHTTRTPSVVKVVPDDDPRPALGTTGAISHFNRLKAKQRRQQ